MAEVQMAVKAQGAIERKVEPPVKEQVTRLGNAVDRAHALVGSLEHSVEDVLNPEASDPGDAASDSPRLASPMVGSLSYLADSIEHLCARMEGILKRVEI